MTAMVGQRAVNGAVLRGVEAIPVSIEVSVSSGLPGFAVVGMADAAVQESRERVRAAIRASGFTMPNEKIVVNLAPSALKKTGSGFDLAIAVGLLAATGQIDPRYVNNALFAGELSLDGGVRPIAGMLAYALCARSLGLALVCSNDTHDVVGIDGLEQLGIGRLADLRTGAFEVLRSQRTESRTGHLDFGEVAGNEMAKRALQIAAAGNHGVLMMGPPGSGKTMLAQRMPSILPPLSEDEVLRVALVHSVVGLDISRILAGERPFRSPHHSSSAAGLIGGGSPLRPGEISLAHLGVLFLDELPEFKPSVLQQLRQPIEQGSVTLTRADGSVSFPARFMLVAASNPCPCGFLGDEEHACTCSVPQIRTYQNRIGGPLVDRIDIHIDVKRVAPETVIDSRKGSSSAEIREGVMKARAFASWRRAHTGCNDASRRTRDVIAACRLDDADKRFFEEMARRTGMSGRGIVRTLSVARTIADMAERAQVGRADLCEAIGLRLREGIGG